LDSSHVYITGLSAEFLAKREELERERWDTLPALAHKVLGATDRRVKMDPLISKFLAPYVLELLSLDGKSTLHTMIKIEIICIWIERFPGYSPMNQCFDTAEQCKEYVQVSSQVVLNILVLTFYNDLENGSLHSGAQKGFGGCQVAPN
jgi:hypothetical protein